MVHRNNFVSPHSTSLTLLILDLLTSPKATRVDALPLSIDPKLFHQFFWNIGGVS